MAIRGQLTPNVAQKMRDFLGHDADVAELRLIPYIIYEAQNMQKIDPRKISGRERDILQLWREAGYIEGGASGLSISKPFWDFANEILWIAYVDFEAQP